MTGRAAVGGPAAGFAGIDRLAVCIGAQKAGTTWLYQALRDHPDVHVPRIKEVHYWDTVHPPHLPFYARKARAAVASWTEGPVARRVARRVSPSHRAAFRDAVRYARMFEDGAASAGAYADYLTAGAGTRRVVADVSPGYAMMERDGFAAMDAAVPDARYVFILRDPFDRLWSNLRHNRSRGHGRVGRDGDLAAALRRAARNPGSGPFRRSDYGRTMAALEAVVPADRIGCFFYETMFEPGELTRMSAFLGIGPIRADAGRRVNAGDPSPPPPDGIDGADEARAALAPVYAWARARFGSALPSAWNASGGG